MSDDFSLPMFTPSDLTSSAAAEKQAAPTREAAPRLRCADRSQLLLRPVDLDATIPVEHEARAIWRFVERIDLSRFLEPIEAREGEPGRDATDPKILVALWLYGTTQAVGSARGLARLCESHDAYRWICGGVSMNHHTLSDFRVGHGKALDELLTQMLAAMMQQGLCTLTRLAQDGTRVRASAGAASFRREPRLKDFLAAAREQVEHVKKLADDPTVTVREAAAQRRAAKEREERVERALEELAQAREAKKKDEKDEARASTTDPESRVMKMGDGGFRPAFNVQFATTTAEGVIVGVAVTNIGSDKSQMTPMLEQVEERTGQRPSEHLVDSGYVNFAAIEEAAKRGTTVYAPPQVKKDGSTYEPQPGESPVVAAWRQRMGTAEAKNLYARQRGAAAELVNASVKEKQGLKLRVRGVKKILCIALWHALAYNLTRWVAATT